MRYFSILFASIFFAGCTKNENTRNLEITGEVQGLKKGTLSIRRIKDSAYVAIDTISISGDSKFSSTINLESPEMLYLFIDRGATNSIDDRLPFFAMPGKMTIETSLGHFLSDAKITGSKDQDLYEEYLKGKSRFSDRNLSLIEMKINAFKSNKPGVIESLSEQQGTNLKRRYFYTVNFALNHKNFEIAPYLAVYEIADINLKYLDTIRKSLPTNIAGSFYGKRLSELCSKRASSEKP